MLLHLRLCTSRTGLLFVLCLLCACGSPLPGRAQEFPKGFVGYLEAQQGLSTNFQGLPDLFVGGLQFRPQYTVIPDQLRLGGTVGFIYTGTHLDGVIGPSLALKVATFSVSPFGTLANMQLQGDYDWTTRGHPFAGGGIRVELGQLLIVGLTVHREFQDNAWFFQTALGFNLFHAKKKAGPPQDPLHPHQ